MDSRSCAWLRSGFVACCVLCNDFVNRDILELSLAGKPEVESFKLGKRQSMIDLLYTTVFGD